MKRIHGICCIFIAMCMALVGCSKSDMYDYVNADQSLVMKINASRVFDNAGIEVTPDGLKVPEALRNVAGRLSGLKGIDFERVILVSGALPQSVDLWLAIAEITDASALQSELEAGGAKEVETKDDCRLYNDAGVTFMVGKSLLFVTNKRAEDTPAFVETLKTLSAEKPLPDWLIDKIEDDSTVSGAINLGRTVSAYKALDPNTMLPAMYSKIYGEGYAGCYSTFKIAVSEDKAKAESKVYNAEGKEVKLALSLPEIDTSLLKYSSADDQIVLMTTALQCDEFKEMTKSLIDQYHLPEAVTLKEIVDNVQGTIMLSGAVDDVKALSATGGWHVTCAMQLTAESAEKTAKTLSGLVGNTDDSAEKADKDKKKEKEADKKSRYNIKTDGPVLVLSLNREIDNTGTTDGKPFKGNVFGMTINVSGRSPETTLISLPFGVSMLCKADSDDSEAEIAISGADKPLLQSILEFISSF